MKTQQQLFCCIGLMALTITVNADESNFGKKIPSTNQVIEALSRPPPLTRSMTAMVPTSSKTKPNVNSKKPYTPVPKIGLSMEINFGYKSAELTASGKDQLQPVGEALASEKLKNMDFVVEGHTDAIGGYAYNMTLSKERAASVKRFLVDTYNIEPSHIKIIGKGKDNLLDANNPDSEVNRRVRIIAIK
jgi:outer membrane protein OmpA-like peptidoglycan-associated protein